MRVKRSAQRIARALLMLCAVTLVGCQAIPYSGEVSAGLDTLNQEEQSVQFSPGGPTVGASPEDIVRGFVAAAASSADDYAVARQFLSPEYRAAWDPSLGVLVDEGTQEFQQGEGGIGVLAVSAIAAVDAGGTLRPVQQGTSTDARFELARTGNEWRISSAPAGIILDKNTFAAAWTPQPVYFLTPDNRLIADTRWFLNRSALGTQVVGELLKGPSMALTEIARTAFPAGTVLASGSVPVIEGVARMEFSPELLNADPATMELIKRQLGASFQAVPEATRFEMLVNGSVVETGSVITAESTVPSSQNQYVAVLREGVFGPAGGAAGTELPEIGATVAALEPTAVSLSPDRRTAAVLNVSGISWVSSSETIEIDPRPGLTQPGLDRFGFVWSYSTDSPQTVTITRPAATSVELPLSWLGESTAHVVRVSQGGMRIAALLPDPERPGYSQVLVAGVVRSVSGVPLAVAEAAVTELWVEGEAIDLDWIDDQRFVVLTTSGVTVRATQGVLGQFSIDSGTVSAATSVSGGGSRSLLRVLDERGRLYAPQGSGWQRQQGDIDVVAKIG